MPCRVFLEHRRLLFASREGVTRAFTARGYCGLYKAVGLSCADLAFAQTGGQTSKLVAPLEKFVNTNRALVDNIVR